MKTPEEYFQDTVSLPDEGPGTGTSAATGAAPLTSAERAFLDKYLGMSVSLKEFGLDRPVTPEVVVGPAASDPVATPAAPDSERPAQDVSPIAVLPVEARTGAAQVPATDCLELDGSENAEADVDGQLKDLPEIQLISFRIGQGEFALPIGVVQEVIRYVQPTKLPTAPAFMAGIVNLRGRITPLIWPRVLMGSASEAGECRFIVVCRRKGLQVGLVVDAVATMYRAAQKDLEWGIEASLGIASEYLVGLLKAEDRLVSIISIDRMIVRLLKS